MSLETTSFISRSIAIVLRYYSDLGRDRQKGYMGCLEWTVDPIERSVWRWGWRSQSDNELGSCGAGEAESPHYDLMGRWRGNSRRLQYYSSTYPNPCSRSPKPSCCPECTITCLRPISQVRSECRALSSPTHCFVHSSGTIALFYKSVVSVTVTEGAVEQLPLSGPATTLVFSTDVYLIDLSLVPETRLLEP